MNSIEKFSGAGASFIWSEDGEEDKPQYLDGKQESGMKIILSVMPEKEKQAQQQLQALLQSLKTQLNLTMSWVHVELEEVTAKHFKLL